MHCLLRCYGLKSYRPPIFLKMWKARINGALYRTMLENFLRPAIEDNQEVWFQQDEVTAPTAKAIIDLLREIFVEFFGLRVHLI